MQPNWKTLKIDHKSVLIPPLLIKTEFGHSSYKVWLTDLTHIWAESVDRRQIIQRTFSVDTSIDPSEDTSQLRLFLQSIEDALTQRAGTTMDVVQSDAERHLTLHTWTPLPNPLSPLKWKIMLIPAAQSVFTTEFLIPLLSQQSTAKAEKVSLLQQLKYKDNVITKLIETMQADGVDLSKVFPSAPTARPGANARDTIGRSVKGLSDFDFEQWQRRMVRDSKSLEELKDLLSNAFDTDSPGISGESQLQDSPDYGDWWSNLEHEKSQLAPATSHMPVADAVETGILDSSSQAQLTTAVGRHVEPRLSKNNGLDLKPTDSRPGSAMRFSANSSTTDDSDLDVQLSKSPRVLPRVEAQTEAGGPSTRKIQKMPQGNELEENGHSPSAVLRNEVSLVKRKGTSKMYDTSSSSDDETTDLDTENMFRSKDPSNGKEGVQVPSISKAKAGLGKIGGKDKTGNRSGSKGVASQIQAVSSVQQQPDGRPANSEDHRSKSRTTPEDSRVTRVITQPTTSSAPKESDQERANKKREQLKRELESKSNIAAKKKRKF